MTRRRSGLALLVLVAAWLRPWHPAADAQPLPPLLVVAAASIRGTDIGMGTLREVFEARSVELGGVRLVPFNLPFGTTERVRFDDAVLGLNPDEVGRFWVDQRVRTGAQPPRTLKSAEFALRVAASLPGALVYVAVPPQSVPEGLKVLTVEGKRPDDPAYPLRGR